MRRLTFLGDVFLPRPFDVRAELDAPFVFNLEHPITSATLGWPGKVNLRAETNHIRATFGLAPAAVCLANNHIMDFGAVGLGDTLRELRQMGVPSFGAGSLHENAGNPALLHDGQVAVLGYACPTTAAVLANAEHPGAAPLELSRIERDLTAARAAGARRVVVSLHWGEEEVFLPKPQDVLTARRLIDAGADLVIGHHAHRPQPFERYRGRYIFYGLGNCIMPDLAEPSYFDASGRSTGLFVKPQHWWNRRSLAVDYDAEANAASVRELLFDGRLLRTVPSRARRYALSGADTPRYARRYRRAFTVGKLRTKVFTYVKNPRRPEARHLRSIVAIAREVTGARP
jgi:poly-gamma-glutamate synthesis protein (capsule biosynthesis protein)